MVIRSDPSTTPLKWNTASLVFVGAGPNGGTATNCSSADNSVVAFAGLFVRELFRTGMEAFKRKKAVSNAGLGMVKSIVPPSAGTFSEAAVCHSFASVGRISRTAWSTPGGKVATKSRLVSTKEMELMTGAPAGTAATIRPHQSIAHNQSNV